MWIRMLVLAGVVAMGATGCVHPGQMTRAAQFNQDNVACLTAAYERLLEDYEGKLNVCLDVQEATLVAYVQEALGQYWNPGTQVLDATKFRDEAATLQAAFATRAKGVEPAEKEQIRAEVALANPLLGDVVVGYLTPADANEIVRMFGTMLRNESSLAAEARKTPARAVYVMKHFYAVKKDILGALEVYKTNARKMTDEAREAATAFVYFSQARTDLLDSVELLKDQSVQTTIADIVYRTSDSAKRRDAAKKLLDELNNPQPADAPAK